MLDGIGDRFLCDSVKMGRNGIVLDQHRPQAFEPAGNIKKLRRIRSQFLQCGHQAVRIELHRRKPLGQESGRMEETLAVSRRIAWLSLAASVVALTAAICAIFVRVIH